MFQQVVLVLLFSCFIAVEKQCGEGGAGNIVSDNRAILAGKTKLTWPQIYEY